MSARWENEKSAIGKVQHLREEIEQVNGEIARAEREYDLNRAAELKYGRLPALQKGAGAGGGPRGGGGKGFHSAARPCDGGGDRPHRGPLDRHPRGEAHGRGARKAAASGRHPAQAGHRPGRSRTARDGGHPAQPRRHRGRKPPHWQLFVPGPDGRGQNGACQSTGGSAVR